MPHKNNNIAASFYRISTANRDIKVSANHIIPAGKCDLKDSFLPLVFASKVWINFHLLEMNNDSAVLAVSQLIICILV